MKLPFSKMHGLGNDFIVIDQRRQDYGLAAQQLAGLADRRLGIGCDQVLFLEPSRRADAAARYRVVNADGSPAEHCGNGIRCIARYLERRGEIDTHVNIEVGDDVFELVLGDRTDVRVDMGRPRFSPAEIPLALAPQGDRYRLSLGERAIEFGAVSMGNPHAVIEVEAVEQADVAGIGAAVQRASAFPASVNVGFMHIVDRAHIQLRVYERGAGETQACGTGACAAMAIGRRWARVDDVVEVGLRGGVLSIEWDGDTDHSLWMTGPATHVFEGTLEL